MGCQIFGPDLKPVGEVQQVPVTGRLYATGQPGVHLPAQARVTWTARGVTRNHALQILGLLTAQLESATRLIDGGRFLSVLRLAQAATPDEGFAGLKWTGTHTYDLSELYYRDADNAPWRTP